MAIETYREWHPVGDLPTDLLVYGLYDDFEGFRILLSRPGVWGNPFLRITFYGRDAYRNTDEGARLRLQELGQDFSLSSLYIVENSSWLEWFYKENYGILKGLGIKHYAIITQNDIIEVLNRSEPDVEWIY